MIVNDVDPCAAPLRQRRLECQLLIQEGKQMASARSRPELTPSLMLIGRSACSRGVLFALMALFLIWPQVAVPADTVNWVQIPGAATAIGAGGGKVWVIGVTRDPSSYDDRIYRWTGGTTGSPWEQIPGEAMRIAVDGSGNAWVVNAQHNISRFNGSVFEQIPGAATDIGAGGGKIWVIGVTRDHSSYEDKIYRWTGGMTGIPWEQIPGEATRIAVDGSGNAWAVNALHNIYRFNGSAFEQIP